jgi:dynein heavy chain
VYIQAALDKKDKSKVRSIMSTFSAQTNANAVQDIIDSKLDKRRKGVFGPPVGFERAVVFVDDLNMPSLEEYGAQPPIELVRCVLGLSQILPTVSSPCVTIYRALLVTLTSTVVY